VGAQGARVCLVSLAAHRRCPAQQWVLPATLTSGPWCARTGCRVRRGVVRPAEVRIMRTKHATKLYRLAAAAARSAPPSALCAPWPSALLGWPWHQCTRCCARWCTPNEAVAGAVRAWQRGALSGLSVRPCCSTMRQRATWSPAPAARERFSICRARARKLWPCATPSLDHSGVAHHCDASSLLHSVCATVCCWRFSPAWATVCSTQQHTSVVLAVAFNEHRGHRGRGRPAPRTPRPSRRTGRSARTPGRRAARRHSPAQAPPAASGCLWRLRRPGWPACA